MANYAESDFLIDLFPVVPAGDGYAAREARETQAAGYGSAPIAASPARSPGAAA